MKFIKKENYKQRIHYFFQSENDLNKEKIFEIVLNLIEHKELDFIEVSISDEENIFDGGMRLTRSEKKEVKNLFEEHGKEDISTITMLSIYKNVKIGFIFKVDSNIVQINSRSEMDFKEIINDL